MHYPSLTIWDSPDSPPKELRQVYIWNGYDESDGISSILKYVDDNGVRLRSKYLAWIYELGESKINGKTLIDRFTLGDGFSYWWMTLFAEKSPWKSPVIVDIMRIFAIEEIVSKQKIKKVFLVSSNQKLHRIFKEWFRKASILYSWNRINSYVKKKYSIEYIIRKVFNSILPSLQGLLFLVRYLFTRYRSKKTKKQWLVEDNSVFICSYFANLNAKLCTNGMFYSHQWCELPKFLHSKNIKINWLHHYIKHNAISSIDQANSLLEQFNRNADNMDFHLVLDQYLSLGIIFMVLVKWLQISLLAWSLFGMKKIFQPCGYMFTLWPLLRVDWNSSMFGVNAIQNLFFVGLFNAAMQDIPKQNKGLYLCENQAWERALIHAWRKNKHGELIAVPHTSIRFWDLRYFFDSRTFLLSNNLLNNPMPHPDIIVLNGNHAVATYNDIGYPGNFLAKGEALRYNYLDEVTKCATLLPKNTKVSKILILGDYLEASTVKMLQILETANAYISTNIAYSIKLHPVSLVNIKDYSSLNIKILNSPLVKILGQFDLVYASNLTTSAVEAFLLGLPVIVMLDNETLNYSPLREQAGVRFISNSNELADILGNLEKILDQNYINPSNKNNYFFTDAKLSRWANLLCD